MLTPAEIWKMLHLNRKERRTLASKRWNREPHQHLSRQDMGITTRPQFKPKKPKG